MHQTKQSDTKTILIWSYQTLWRFYGSFPRLMFIFQVVSVFGRIWCGRSKRCVHEQIQKHFDFMGPRQSETHRICVCKLWSVKDLEQKLIIKAGLRIMCRFFFLSVRSRFTSQLEISKNTRGFVWRAKAIDVFEVMSRRRYRRSVCCFSWNWKIEIIANLCEREIENSSSVYKHLGRLKRVK